MNEDAVTLPDGDEAGVVRAWSLPVNATESGSRIGDLRFISVYGRFLGLGTSHTVQHTQHDSRFVLRGTRCNACRWFEARIFRELLLPNGVDSLDELDRPDDVTLGSYVIHSAGMSIVDDEVPFFRYETTRSAFQVVELMTTRRTTDRGPEAFLAKPAAHALAEAAGFDRQLQDAYINRAVS